MRGPLSFGVGCEWRVGASDLQQHGSIVPPGFIRYRQQLCASGAPATFRLHPVERRPVKLLVRMGCIGAAALSGRFASGGIVTSSNPQLCGNKSPWWGFLGKQNADGALREAAGPGLAAECESLRAVGADGEKLLACGVRSTGAHRLAAARVLHALAPTSHRSPTAESALRRTYDRCLHTAEELALPSLAMPALGCGVSGFPASVGARAAFDAIERFYEEASLGGEERATNLVEFVLLDEKVFAAFADAAYVRWGRL